jgi:hypothetical protein
MIEALMFIQTIVFGLTLIILIIQTRHLQRTIYSSNYGRMIEMLKELRVLRINNPSLAKVYASEVEGLTDEQIRFHFFNLIVLSILEMLYIDWSQGLISKETWEYWLDAIRKISHEQSFRDMVLRKSYKIVNPEFSKIVESIVCEVESNVKQCA